jgi:hypothetical protein
MITIALDPGDLHTGWAEHYSPGPGMTAACAAGTMDSSEVVEWLDQRLRRIRSLKTPTEVEVIIEEYVLYPGQDQRRVYKKNATSELIGMIKLTCMHHGITWIEQGATIKKPTRKQLRARGIGYASGDEHSRDAQLHLWYRVLRRNSA